MYIFMCVCVDVFVCVTLIIGLSGNQFHFLSNGDPPASYRILNFRRTDDQTYKWVTVGRYENKQLTV